MKILPLTLALTTASALATEKPIELPVIDNTQSRVQETVSSTGKCDKVGSGALVILGSLLLGSAGASWADAEYRKRVPLEKRIGTRVLQKMGDTQEL